MCDLFPIKHHLADELLIQAVRPAFMAPHYAKIVSPLTTLTMTTQASFTQEKGLVGRKFVLRQKKLSAAAKKFLVLRRTITKAAPNVIFHILMNLARLFARAVRPGTLICQ